jgi:catechol 2,3-dioxygenase-like lactoylglutathione lyase family enzyme
MDPVVDWRAATDNLHQLNTIVVRGDFTNPSGLSIQLMMQLEQIDHIALRCASPRVSKEWYVTTLGFEEVFTDQCSGVPIVLRLGSTFITLFPQKVNEQPSADGRAWHLAFRAATYAHFRSAQAELQARGAAFQFQNHEIAHSIYFYDPDGFLLEITTYDISNVGDRTNPAVAFGT